VREEISRLSCPYDRAALLRADLAPAQTAAHKAESSWWLPRQINGMKCRAYLRSTVGAKGKPDWASDLPVLLGLQVLDRELGGLSAPLGRVAIWRQHDTDPDLLKEQHRLASQLRAALAGLAESAEMLPA